ncbi:hypothetical protein COLO4_28913 [Corchorus olitorius]|uniref:RNase H type-1 domain-containing protein n=1 Tax=Corchorus olitorius TaxID=93759 RepID=A0A1R3HHI9_9ROSI|nr:hypothetical protein COLO4_28913 [Corchorus olitorius]
MEGVRVEAENSEVAEALVIKEVYRLAKEKGFSKVMFESDSTTVVRDITRKDWLTAWKTSKIVEEIRNHLTEFAEAKILLEKREANSAADWVEKQYNMGMELSNWVDRPPSSINPH